MAFRAVRTRVPIKSVDVGAVVDLAQTVASIASQVAAMSQFPPAAMATAIVLVILDTVQVDLSFLT